jgi:N-formylglutamate deformylase
LLKDQIDGVYRIDRPQGPALPLVFDSPHSGRIYPADFGYACPEDALRRAEDNEIDLLFDSVPAHGGALLCAEFPRTYIDANRQEDDLDPELIDGPLPPGARPDGRSYAGIGLVRRIVRPGLPLYDRKLGLDEIQRRIDGYYRPYHAALASLIEEAHYNYGFVWHLNCHSMPASTGIAGQPDFVLGDRDGTSCDPAFTAALKTFLKGFGYRVALNNPYKGVELVRRHGRPREGYHSLQIEINKGLYWNELKNQPNRQYNALKADIGKLVAFCAGYAAASETSIAAD